MVRERKHKDARITTIYLDKDNDDYLTCPTCTIKLTPFVNAKLREFRNTVQQPTQPLPNLEKAVQINDALTHEVKQFVRDLKEKSFYNKMYNENDFDGCLGGRCKIIKHRIGIELKPVELKKLVNNELVRTQNETREKIKT